MSRPRKGPYGLGPRLRWLLERGRIYLSRNPGSGRPALVEVPTGATPLRVPTGAVQVLVTTYPSPSPATAVELRAGRVEHLHNALDLAASLAESALDEPDARAHLSTGQVMYSPPPVVSVTVQPARERTPSWLHHAVAVAVVVAVVVPWSPEAVVAAVWPSAIDRVAPGVGGSERVEFVAPSADEAEGYLGNIVEFQLRMGEKPICATMPEGPFPGQDTPPNCRSPSRPVNGGCWAKLDDKPNPCCPPNTVEKGGACYFGLKGGVPMTLPKRRSLMRVP